MKRIDQTNWWPWLILLVLFGGTMAGTVWLLDKLILDCSEQPITCEKEGNPIPCPREQTTPINEKP